MKVGDLVRLKKPVTARYQVFLVLRTEAAGPYGRKLKVWVCPDPYADEEGYTDINGYNYYYGHFFEVVSESR